jgi:hypothetical protein
LIGDSSMMSLRTLFSMVSATASLLFRIPSGSASTAAVPRSTMSWTSDSSSNADTFSLTSAP